jgi:hypothetical protein
MHRVRNTIYVLEKRVLIKEILPEKKIKKKD